jgi:hypothetical protein
MYLKGIRYGAKLSALAKNPERSNRGITVALKLIRYLQYLTELKLLG